jgi:16S rRNA (cytidine1402-2'-O)-methyltransferase
MLYVVATPIGNLGDITLRALETLRAVDYVASEDTRRTGTLLRKLGIQKPQISFREGNERSSGEKLLAHLTAGRSVALVTDAGTPAVSDPGFTLIRSALAQNIDVIGIPGPTACILALVLSGLPVHGFTFRGFPPRRTSARQRFLRVDEDSPHTLIFYESPYRLDGFLSDALTVYGNRQAAIANDLTKLHEHVYRGPLADLIALCEGMTLKGEFTVVIAGANLRPPAGDEDDDGSDR